jgi:alpha-L-arabinofuranosidase
MDRRTFVRIAGAGTGALSLDPAAALGRGPRSDAHPAPATLLVDPRPRFEFSPHLYMQFMEPLGATDGSVEASWDHDRDDWREDLVAATRDLGPDVIRWGGLFTRYYKWREGVGPTAERPWMYNHVWGGRESNRVGTHELVDFCRRVGAEPMLVVNFLSDGHREYARTVHGQDRRGDAREAADWVSYANDPDDAERIRHGVREPYGVKLWQLGNETNYSRDGFSLDEAIAHTLEFARAMRQRDPSIQLIGWGDDALHDGDFWAPAMLRRAGEHLDQVAIHMMGMIPASPDTLLRGFEYQKDPAGAWDELLEMTGRVERRLHTVRQIMQEHGPGKGLAITEGHLSLNPHNANPILQEWLSAVYHARTLNLYERNGDLVTMSTGADFAGTRWTVNAVQIPVPRGRSFLLPVAVVTRLYKRHRGAHGAAVAEVPAYLDVAASRDPDRVYLHVLNTSFHRPVETTLAVQGLRVRGGRVWEIAPEDPRAYVDRNNPTTFDPVERTLPAGDLPSWRFPPRSVSAVELDLEAGPG